MSDSITIVDVHTHEWKEFLEVVDAAEKQSPGVRAKIACCLYQVDNHDEPNSHLLPPEYKDIEDFGFNHILGNVEEPLEFVRTPIGSVVGIDTVEQAEAIKKGIDDGCIKSVLESKPNVLHAEIHAMYKNFDSGEDLNAMFVSQTPCCNCGTVIDEYMFIQHLTFRRFYRDPEAFFDFVRKTKTLKTISMVADSGKVYSIKVLKDRESTVQALQFMKDNFNGM